MRISIIRAGLLGLGGIGLVLLIWAWTQPSQWIVSRQVLVDAPAGVVYPVLVNQSASLGLGYDSDAWRDEIVSANRLSGIDISRQYRDRHAVQLIRFRMRPDPRGVMLEGTVSGDWGWNPLLRLIPGTMDSRYGPALASNLNRLKNRAESEWKANRPVRPISF